MLPKLLHSSLQNVCSIFFPLPFSCSVYLNWHLGRFAFTITADQPQMCSAICLIAVCKYQYVYGQFIHILYYVFTVSSKVIKSSFICSFVSVLSPLAGRKLLSSFIVESLLLCLEATPPKTTTYTQYMLMHVREAGSQMDFFIIYVW